MRVTGQGFAPASGELLLKQLLAVGIGRSNEISSKNCCDKHVDWQIHRPFLTDIPPGTLSSILKQAGLK